MDKTSDSILITGATGFLGSWIISGLVDAGIPVIATDISPDHHRLQELRPDLPAHMVDFRVCDVTDAEALETMIEETRPTGIIHLAALQIPVCRVKPAAGAAVNIIGHINIFEAARKFGIKRIIYTSSIAAKPRGPANAPSNLYGVFKKTDEEIARIYWQDHQTPSLG
ncbi:NAD(P)-dependent oxidoreductase, partial [Aliiroseovarius subalbicans]|uniref:NAD-dependent epimerase/dehydratase family protein n=1 Tax=Aliiroseovarius subalbicans TaxID=2925840 RepID=UPI001F5AD1AD